MIGIVFEHSSVFWGIQYDQLSSTVVEIAAMQFFKFVTIAFFIIGGFLINHKFTEYSPVQYLKNRISNTILPWAFWIVILICLDAINVLIIYFRHKNGDDLPTFWSFLGEELYNTIFFTSFWFVLNFLICISVLLVFKKYLYNLWFGVFWGCVSLVYSLNIYHNWFATQHTLALFGYIVYLWLGVYMNKHYDKIQVFIKNISFTQLISLNVVLFSMAIAEALHIANIAMGDWYNTLRVTNIIYSLGMFLLLLKLGNVEWLSKNLQPRNTTFGIYLLHTIILVHVIPELLRHFHIKLQTLGVVEAILLSLAKLVVAYGLSFFLVKLIMKTNFKWSIGVKSS